MVAAYELGLTQINASGHNDPTAETLAQTIVMLAKHGERDPVRLKQRAIEIMSAMIGPHKGVTWRPSGSGDYADERQSSQLKKPRNR
jgi:hypothetical protein